MKFHANLIFFLVMFGCATAPVEPINPYEKFTASSSKFGIDVYGWGKYEQPSDVLPITIQEGSRFGVHNTSYIETAYNRECEELGGTVGFGRSGRQRRQQFVLEYYEGLEDELDIVGQPQTRFVNVARCNNATGAISPFMVTYKYAGTQYERAKNPDGYAFIDLTEYERLKDHFQHIASVVSAKKRNIFAARREAEVAALNNWRSSLEPGMMTKQGLLITLEPPLAEVQTCKLYTGFGSDRRCVDGSRVWLRIDELTR